MIRSVSSGDTHFSFAETVPSIGGAVGTGLFLWTGNAPKNGRPAWRAPMAYPRTLLLGYVIIGTTMMLSRREGLYLPIPGGDIKLAECIVNPAFSAGIIGAIELLGGYCPRILIFVQADPVLKTKTLGAEHLERVIIYDT
ncbi:hypothetical protein BS47DRAFT_1344130 [Hydnum rufescens UP504]|uniref:Uncharacterized protein n=1 Tax=Hydnum rufescens UP504 TaxID=1448309 RepID=A0A9P6AXE0_9AGAM|nr:hypothetical protein BS47DRAFT_1344130 [Hydnum rufescens UP504]